MTQLCRYCLISRPLDDNRAEAFVIQRHDDVGKPLGAHTLVAASTSWMDQGNRSIW
jgi:hypothetical protein